MCRGANLGVCVVEGCDSQIRCQDTGGFCDAHDPYDFVVCECEGNDCTCPSAAPRPPINEAKQLDYAIMRSGRGIESLEQTLIATKARLRDAKKRRRQYLRRQQALS